MGVGCVFATQVAALLNFPRSEQQVQRDDTHSLCANAPPYPHSQLTPLDWACPWCSEARNT